jgi:hypothetical protein
MLTRRRFAGSVCGITEFITTEASAQGAPAATTPGVTRKILSQVDGPTPDLRWRVLRHRGSYVVWASMMSFAPDIICRRWRRHPPSPALR